MRLAVSTAAFLAVLAIASSARAAVNDVDASCELHGTAVYFGNGVATAYDDALWTSLAYLPPLAEEAGIDDVNGFDVAYNHSDGLMRDILETLELPSATRRPRTPAAGSAGPAV